MNRYFSIYSDHLPQNKNQTVSGEPTAKATRNSTISRFTPGRKSRSSNPITPRMTLEEFYQGKCIKIDKDCIPKVYS